MESELTRGKEKESCLSDESGGSMELSGWSGRNGEILGVLWNAVLMTGHQCSIRYVHGLCAKNIHTLM